MRRTQASERGVDALRGAFSGANLRQLLGIVDRGRVLLAKVKAATGEALVQSDGKDLLVRVIDVLSDQPLLARLHIPMNMLWRKPREGETLTVVVPGDLNGPGSSTALYGDAGATAAVPPWLDTESGVYAPGKVRVQSADDDVTVHAPTGKHIKLGEAATKGVNRQGDAIAPGTLTFTATTSTLTITYNPGTPGSTPTIINIGVGGSPAVFTPFGPTTVTLGGVTGPGSNKLKGED